jgi:hypothetical protein
MEVHWEALTVAALIKRVSLASTPRTPKGQKVIASWTGQTKAADGVSSSNEMAGVRPDLVRPTGRQAPA